MITIILSIAVLLVWGSLTVAIIMNKHLPIWFCDKLGWHLPVYEATCQGTTLYGICPRCGRLLHRDGLHIVPSLSSFFEWARSYK